MLIRTGTFKVILSYQYVETAWCVSTKMNERECSVVCVKVKKAKLTGTRFVSPKKIVKSTEVLLIKF